MTEEAIDVRPSGGELLHGGAAACDVCGVLFPHTSARQLHMVKTHRVIRNPKDYSLFHRSSLQVVKGNRRFFCPVKTCTYFDGIWFNTLRQLKQHYQKMHVPKTLECRFCPQVRFSLQRDQKYHEKICPLRPKSAVPSANDGATATAATDPQRTPAIVADSDCLNESEVVDVVAVSRSDTALDVSSSAEQSSDRCSVKRPPRKTSDTSRGVCDIAIAARNASQSTSVVFVCVDLPCTDGAPGRKLRRLAPRLVEKPCASTQVEPNEFVMLNSTATQTDALDEMLNVSAQVDQVDLLGLVAFDQQDFVCQTVYPDQIDSGTQMVGGGLSSLDAMICGGTQTDLEFEELLRHTETQTLFPGGELADARTQTLLIDFIESGFTDAEKCMSINGNSRSVGI